MDIAVDSGKSYYIFSILMLKEGYSVAGMWFSSSGLKTSSFEVGCYFPLSPSDPSHQEGCTQSDKTIFFPFKMTLLSHISHWISAGVSFRGCSRKWGDTANLQQSIRMTSVWVTNYWNILWISMQTLLLTAYKVRINATYIIDMLYMVIFMRFTVKPGAAVKANWILLLTVKAHR